MNALVIHIDIIIASATIHLHRSKETGAPTLTLVGRQIFGHCFENPFALLIAHDLRASQMSVSNLHRGNDRPDRPYIHTYIGICTYVPTIPRYLHTYIYYVWYRYVHTYQTITRGAFVAVLSPVIYPCFPHSFLSGLKT